MATRFEGRTTARPGCIDIYSAPRPSPRTSLASASLAYASTASLDSLIQVEIIPRLLVAHPPRTAAIATPAAAATISDSEVERFAALPLMLEADELLDHVETFIARGVPVESILVDLLAPSARRLGQAWDDDICDFVDVTMGLWRLQEVMREIAMRVPAVAEALSAPRSALFSPMPGEQHSFGVLMIEEVFSRAGWRSEALLEPRRHELLGALAGRNFDLVGLTISCDCPSGILSELITAMRSVSKNPAIQILIGGPAVNANPHMAASAGADGTAPDASTALALAEEKVFGSRQLDHIV